jgi:putative spermidine/putrescine transport system ATP-binding protein
MSSALEIIALTKAYGRTSAIQDASLRVGAGEILVILGPSGSGKSTLLKCVAGLIEPSSGTILLHGRDITNIPIHQRNLGLVVQGYSLFPHLTAFDNVAYPLRTKAHRCTANELHSRVTAMLDLAGLKGLGERKPNQLSGGQQQRVALARALVFGPDVLLLDEPLAALDRELRERMELEIRNIQRTLKTTILYVTHDQVEAMDVADRIAILNNGRIAQAGKPTELYWQPESEFVARFLGGANLLDGVIIDRQPDLARVQTAVGQLAVSLTKEIPSAESHAIMVRPENLRLDAPTDKYNKLSATLEDLTFLGSSYRATVALANGSIWHLSVAPKDIDGNLKVGRSLDLYWRLCDTQLIVAEH